jgi:Ni,Fe-hydrogenase III large subunit
MSAEPRGRFGLDANARLLVIKIQSEIGHLTVENVEAKDDSKSSKRMEAPQGEQIVSFMLSKNAMVFC